MQYAADQRYWHIQYAPTMPDGSKAQLQCGTAATPSTLGNINAQTFSQVFIATSWITGMRSYNPTDQAVHQIRVLLSYDVVQAYKTYKNIWHIFVRQRSFYQFSGLWVYNNSYNWLVRESTQWWYILWCLLQNCYQRITLLVQELQYISRKCNSSVSIFYS